METNSPTLFFSDNPHILKQIESTNKNLAFQLYDCRIKHFVTKEDDVLTEHFSVQKRVKRKSYKKSIATAKKIIAIVSSSNFRLLNDIRSIQEKEDVEILFYSWESWLKMQPADLNFEHIQQEYLKYMQRGYLTQQIYQQLLEYNMVRVEQFIISLMISVGEKALRHSKKLAISNKYRPILPYSRRPRTPIDTFGTIRILMEYKNLDYKSSIKELMDNYKKGIITNPLEGTYILIDRKSKFYLFVTQYSASDVYCGIDEGFEKGNGCGLTTIVSSLKSIIPIPDILRGLEYMEKSDIIKSIGHAFYSNVPFTNTEIKKYSNYISSNIWEEVYLYKTFKYSAYFPAIDINKVMFICPICQSQEYFTNPGYYRCSDQSCKFTLSRFIYPFGEQKRLNQGEFVRLIKHNKAAVKNKSGGYTTIYLNKSQNSSFFVTYEEKRLGQSQKN